VNVERRMSISSYLMLERRVKPRPDGGVFKEPLWLRWYVPLLTAAMALVALIIAAVAALELVTATPPGARLAPGSHAEPAPDVELINAAER